MKKLLLTTLAIFTSAYLNSMEAPHYNQSPLTKFYNPRSLVKLAARTLAKKAIEVYDSGEDLTREQRYNSMIDYIRFFVIKLGAPKESILKLYDEIINNYMRSDIFVRQLLYLNKSNAREALDFFDDFSEESQIKLGINLIMHIINYQHSHEELEELYDLFKLFLKKPNPFNFYNKILNPLNTHQSIRYNVNPEEKLIQMRSKVLTLKTLVRTHYYNCLTQFHSNYTKSPELSEHARMLLDICRKNTNPTLALELRELIDNIGKQELESLIHDLINSSVELPISIEKFFEFIYPESEERFSHASSILCRIYQDQDLKMLINKQELSMIDYKLGKCYMLNQIVRLYIDSSLRKLLCDRTNNDKIVSQLTNYYVCYGIDFIRYLIKWQISFLKGSSPFKINVSHIKPEDEEHISSINLKIALMEFLKSNYLTENEFKVEFESIEEMIAYTKLYMKKIVEPMQKKVKRASTTETSKKSSKKKPKLEEEEEEEQQFESFETLNDRYNDENQNKEKEKEKE